MSRLQDMRQQFRASREVHRKLNSDEFDLV